MTTQPFREQADEAKRRIRTAIKLFHNADEHWFNEMIDEHVVGAPRMTIIDWIDQGISTALEAAAKVDERLMEAAIVFIKASDDRAAGVTTNWFEYNTCHEQLRAALAAREAQK